MPIVESSWATLVEQAVSIDAGDVRLKGELVVPEDPFGLVLFAAGDGLSRVSSRSRQITQELEEQGLATLALDLLTPGEETGLLAHGACCADASILAKRMGAAMEWIKRQPELRDYPVGFFGTGIGAAAAIHAAAVPGRSADAVVCWGGRSELVCGALESMRVPTLLLTGDGDAAQVQANESALFRLASPRKELILIPGMSSRFAEPGDPEVIADLVADWFSRYLILVS